MISFAYKSIVFFILVSFGGAAILGLSHSVIGVLIMSISAAFAAIIKFSLDEYNDHNSN